MGDYLRLTHAAPQATVPLQEVGLKTLSSLTSALVHADAATSAPIIAAVSKMLDNVAPLRMFNDISPARSHPEAPLVISPAQVTADSTRGDQYEVNTILSLDPATVDTKKYWCSKARPQHHKSSITLYFTRPEQLTGVHLHFPELKLQSEHVGLEVLRAPDDVDTPAEIAEFIHSSKATWTVLGVLPPGSANGRRLPITAHHAVGLRVSFKGFAKGNTDKYHALCSLTLYGATNKLYAHKGCTGMGGVAPHTDSTALLFALNKWLKNTADTAAAASTSSSTAVISPAASDAAVSASLRALASLSLSTGSLATLMALTEALVKHTGPLPAPTAAHLRAVLARISTIGYERVALSSLIALNGGIATGGGSGSNPDKFSEAKFTQKSTYVDIKDGEVAHRVRSTSSPEYAALNIGISSGTLVWEMKIEEDSHGGECQCFGLIRKPISSFSYDGSNDMWMWRAFNGALYAQGSQTTSKERFHQGEIVKFELNMDTGECKGWVNGRDQGVLWKDLGDKGTLYPAVQFYSSGREASLVSIQLYDASTAGGEGAAGGASFTQAWLESLTEADAVPPPTGGASVTPFTTVIPTGSVIGKGGILGATPAGGADAAGKTAGAPIPASLHGLPVSHGINTQLPTEGAGGVSRVCYSLTPEEKEGKAKGKKGDKDRRESPYTVFEAVVGIADFVSQAEGSTSAKVGGGAASASSSASGDASDSKEGPSVERESKEDAPAQAARASASGVPESKDDDDATPSARAAPSGSTTSVTLRVLADGKPVWESPRPILLPTAGLPSTAAAYASLPAFHVVAPIAGADKLELEAVTDGATVNAWVVWGDARLRGADFALDRAAVEKELEEGLPQAYRSLRAAAVTDSPLASTPTTTQGKASAAAAFSPTTSLFPLAAAAGDATGANSSGSTGYTSQLLGQESLTGPEAATALLRILRVLSREAYKPVRVSTPPAPFGSQSPISLEVPFAVQAHGKVFVDAASILQRSLDALQASSTATATASTTLPEHNEIILSLLMVIKGNLRRLTATRVLPSDLGIVLAGEDAASREAEGKATPKHLAGKPEESYGPTLQPLLSVLTALMATATGTGTGAGDKRSAVWPEVAAEAASVIDTGLPLFYPTQASQAAFLTDVLGTGTGGVLEVHFPWPTLLKQSDKHASSAIAALITAGKAASTGKDGKEGSATATAAGGLTGPAKGALEDLAKGKGALSVLNDGSDPRFERAILALQALATARGWQHTTVGVWGHSLHLVAHVPDTASAPIARTLGSDLARVLESAGINGWSFPQGVSSPEITFKVERFLRFNRRERLATDPGIAWVRLYPTSVATLDGVVTEVRSFLDAQRAAAATAAAATASAVGGGAAGGAAGAEEKKEGEKGDGDATKGGKKHHAARVVDVFGDHVDAAEEGGSPSSGGGDDAHSVASGHTGASPSAGADDDDDDDDGEEDEDDDTGSHYSDE